MLPPIGRYEQGMTAPAYETNGWIEKFQPSAMPLDCGEQKW
jgi:hypothetical protein